MLPGAEQTISFISMSNRREESCPLENPRDGGAWWAAVYGVPQSRTRLKRLGGSRAFLIVGLLDSFCYERTEELQLESFLGCY